MDKLDKQYIRIAEIWSENSHARRKKVGAIVVKDRTIISDGYNGMPSGFPNDCEYESATGLVTRPELLHAEANAISKLARGTMSSVGATLYTLVSPCMECSKLIVQSGITRVVFKEAYRDLNGIGLLKKAGIQVDQAGS